MDIDIVDFFRSAYVMDVDTTVKVVDKKLINAVKQSDAMQAIDDPVTRKHQEALAIWQRTSYREKLLITRQFNEWLGNENGNGDGKGDGEDEDDGDGENKIVLHGKTVQIFFPSVSKNNDRKKTTPIYKHTLSDCVASSMYYHITSMDVSSFVRIFDEMVEQKYATVIWKTIHKNSYNDSHVMPFHVIGTVFNHVPYRITALFKHAYCDMVFIMHMIILSSGIYDAYLTFKDYKNLAGHIILRGEKYCKEIIKNPEKIIRVLEFQLYHPIWDHFRKTL